MNEPIAIVGVGCRFPKADDAASFFRLLRDNVDAIGEVPADRWDTSAIYHPDRTTPGHTYARRGGFLSQVDQFDAAYFGISPREAASMDPQTRLVLEVAKEAFDDACFDRARYGTKTGVYIGLSGSDYQDILLADREQIDGYVATGTAMSIAANRVSHAFDLHGPSMAVDTACSSSLVAVHLACNALASGEADAALAGGVCLLLRPEMTIGFTKGFMLSPDAECRAFDASGNGFVRGEGAGVVLLKRLSDAIRDRDAIYAVILATNVNQDGHTPTGIAVPNGSAQRASLETAYRKAGVDPRMVRYVEAHGPGTPVGDPIEAGALGEVLGHGRGSNEELVIGSVKTNIGHLEPAAGIAGLLKVALSLTHEVIPANLHFSTPNPKIDFERLRIRVPSVNEPWPANGERRVAGVNSFGFGGTNAHVVLAGAEHYVGDSPGLLRCWPSSSAPASTNLAGPTSLLLSAKTPEALKMAVVRIADALSTAEVSVADLCSTAARRELEEHRVALVASSSDQVEDALRAWARGEVRPGVRSGKAPASGHEPRIGFVFCGMGSHWWAMGRELLAYDTAFRAIVLDIDRIVGTIAGWSLHEELTRPDESSRLDVFDIAQPAMFAVQCGLVASWRSHGVAPAAIGGHSGGEVAAAWAAGALSLEDATRVVVERSVLQVTTQGKGRLLALGMAESDMAPYLVGRPGISIAAVNGPDTVTLAGDPAELEAVVSELEPRGVFARFLRADVPAHSPAMDPLRGPLVARLHAIEARVPAPALYSTVTGAPIAGASTDAAYWGENFREPVRFALAVRRMMADGIDTFVEIGPQPVLAQAIAECAAADRRSVLVLPSLRRGEPERAAMIESLGALRAAGAIPARSADEGKGGIVSLPTYPWQRQRHWKEPRVSELARSPRRGPTLLGIEVAAPLPSWELTIGIDRQRYMYDHAVQGAVIWPAASFAEMALEAIRAVDPSAGAIVLVDLGLERALVMPEDAVVLARTTLDPKARTVSIHGRSAGKDEWTLQSKTRYATGSSSPAKMSVADVLARCSERVSSEDFYAKLVRMGDQFGPVFQSVREIFMGDRECLARIAPSGVETDVADVQLHPVLLDGCFQSIVAMLPEAAEGSALPRRIRQIRVLAPVRRGPVYAHARLTRQDDDGFAGDVTVMNEDGRILVEVRGFEFQSLEASSEERAIHHVPRWELLHGSGSSASPLPALGTLADRLAPIERAVARSRGAHYDRARPALEALATAYAVEALASLGTTGAVAARHAKLFARIVHHLDAAAKEAAPRTANAEALRRELLAAFPEYVAEISLIARCGAALGDVLSGREDPLPLFFGPDASQDLEHLYATGPTARVYNELLVHALAAAAEAAGRPIRVLEVGAGTGGTTVHLEAALRPYLAEYVSTDVSSAFRRRGEGRFVRSPNLRFATVDLERALDEQGLEAGSFDIVVAADVVHATTDVRAVLGRLASMLRSGGVLAMIELTRPPFWLDLTFGLLEGWWAFADHDLRPDHAILPADAWRRALEGHGLSVTALSDRRDGCPAEQTVFLAQRLGAPPILHRPAPTARGRWMVLGRPSGAAGLLAEDLRQAGADVLAVEDDLSGIGSVVAHAPDLRGIIDCRALDGGETAATALTEQGVALARTLAQASFLGRLVLMTCGAASVDGVCPDLRIEQAALVGLGRVLVNEHPEWRPLLVDVDDMAVAATRDELLRHLELDGREDEIAIRGGAAWGRRWRRADLPARSSTVTPLAPHEVDIEISWEGLDENGVRALAGRAVSIGRTVKRIRPGDQVAAIGFAQPSGKRVSLPARQVTVRSVAPEAWVSGASAYVVLGTVLRRSIGLGATSTLWIHGPGASELSAASAALGRLFDLRVVVSTTDGRATNTTPMVDGRSIRLGDDVREALGGPADVAILLEPVGRDALDALAGRARVWCTPAVAAQISLSGDLLARGVTIGTFDPIEIVRDEPSFPDALAMLDADLAGGRLPPLPSRIGVGVARRNVIPGRKTIFEVPSECSPSPVAIHSDATYLITGGLGGLGIELARHLAARGATRLVLAGRGGASSAAAREAVDELRREGVDVIVERADVTSRDDVARLVAVASADEGRPLRGVAHAAMVLEDRVVAQLDAECIRRVVRPKVDGALLLDQLTSGVNVDFFLLFSSFASVVGNPGQGAYAAANAVLDALALRRRSAGRPATTINWGFVGGAGWVAEHGAVAAHLQNLGIRPMSLERAMAVVDASLGSPETQLVVIDVDWDRWTNLHAAGAAARFSMLRDAGERSALRSDLEAEVVASIDVVSEEIAKALRTATSSLGLDTPLTSLGFDSLMAVELRATLRNRLGVEVPAMKLMGGPTVRELAAFVDEQRGGPVSATSSPPSGAVPVLPNGSSSWLRCRQPLKRPDLRLICVPYNGGTAASFHGFAEHLPRGIEMQVAALPGQLDRRDERAPEDLRAWAAGLARAIAPLADTPLAFYGHSLGGIVAFETIRELRRLGVRAPEALVVGAIHAPHLPDPFPRGDRLTDIDTLSRLGMLDALAPLLADTAFVDELRPVVQSGIRLLADYRFAPQPALDCPLIAFGGTADAIVIPDHLEGWREHTNRAFLRYQFEGGHLFHQERAEEVTAAIVRALSAAREKAVA